MKKFLIGGAAAAAIIGGGAAVAQNAPRPKPMLHMAAPMTRAAIQAQVQAKFAKLDANRDGFITKAEGEAVKQQLHAGIIEGRAERAADGKRSGRDQMFDRVDANHDGMISRDEFASVPRPQSMIMRGSGMRGMRGMGGQMFERTDANRDGRVSLVEAQRAALAHFETMDLNRDGTVTFEEREQARQIRKQHKPA